MRFHVYLRRRLCYRASALNWRRQHADRVLNVSGRQRRRCGHGGGARCLRRRVHRRCNRLGELPHDIRCATGHFWRRVGLLRESIVYLRRCFYDLVFRGRHGALLLLVSGRQRRRRRIQRSGCRYCGRRLRRGNHKLGEFSDHESGAGHLRRRQRKLRCIERSLRRRICDRGQRECAELPLFHVFGRQRR